MTQAEARQLAISRGFDPAEVDAFIQREGGARTSAERISSAFQQTPGSGAGPAVGTPSTPTGLGSPMAPSAASGLPSMSALNKVVEPTAAGTPGSEPTNAALTALSGLTAGGGAGNGQEMFSADQQSGGMLRMLGRRNPPSGALVLTRKAY